MDKLITFEGTEGSGKSTQIRLVAEHLTKLKIPLVITQEPTGTDIGRKIGGILFNREHHSMCAEAEVFLFCAARAQHVREKIMPALKQDQIVLCDRFSDATFAYQGFGRGLNLEFIQIIDDYSSLKLKPNLTLLFDLPVETGLKRAMERDNLLKDSSAVDRFEREKLDFHNRVRKGYLTLYKNEPERFRLIDAARDVNTIQEEVQKQVLAFINR
jgi:dTMP kinase